MTQLSDIPIKLRIKDDNYVLCGVVKYIPPVHTMGHYIALCRSIHNNWSERNDLAKNKKSVSKKILPNLNISGIFYIKSNDN